MFSQYLQTIFRKIFEEFSKIFTIALTCNDLAMVKFLTFSFFANTKTPLNVLQKGYSPIKTFYLNILITKCNQNKLFHLWFLYPSVPTVAIHADLTSPSYYPTMNQRFRLFKRVTTFDMNNRNKETFEVHQKSIESAFAETGIKITNVPSFRRHSVFPLVE